MSNIISILEKLGANASFQKNNVSRNSSDEVLLQHLDAGLVQFLRVGEIKQAEQLLGARSDLVCGLHPAEEPDGVPPADQPEDDKENESVKFQHIA